MLRKKMLMAFKTEGTPGTAESLTASEAAINCFVTGNPLSIDEQMEDREQQTTFNQLSSARGPSRATLTFETELVGTGAAVISDPLKALIRACAYTESSGTCAPTSLQSSMAPLTAAVYQEIDGGTNATRDLVVGCMGNFVLTLRHGRPNRFRFTLTGKYGGQSQVTHLAPTYPTIVGPRGVESLTINSLTTLRTDEIEIDCGNDVQLLETVVNDTYASGYAYAVVRDRDTRIRLRPERLVVGTVDWRSLLATPTLFDFSATVGSASNNTQTITDVGSSQCQVVNRTHGDRNKIATEELELKALQGVQIVFA